MHLNIFISVLLSLVIEISSDYLVRTDECSIPNFAARSKEAQLYIPPDNFQRDKPCPNPELLTGTIVKNGVPYLHLYKRNKLYKSKNKELPTCCYREITRNGTEEEPDIGISIGDCIPFQDSVKIENDVKVQCELDSVIIYKNVHSPIYITESVQKKMDEAPPAPGNRTKISVLFVVIDSLSRINFERTMSMTKTYLDQIGFVEFVGYNKVDDNTFPNAMALLSGMNLKQVYSKCNPREVGKLDECPMVWYDFRNFGYATAYAEDWADCMTFNYQKKGFQNPPTDYYFKPYIEAAETLNVTYEHALPYCTGPETEGERILKLAKDFSTTFIGKPSFGIFWMNTFSHNYINSPKIMDKKVASFFQDIERRGVLNESIVILLSDHGIRFGKFRQTIQGWFEERLPILSISIPQWFKTQYKEKYKNFKGNVGKLISTYDLYMTLQDVLEMSVEDYNKTSSLACPRCHSLFSEITEVRSCRDAGIPEAWCTCVGEFVANDTRINEDTNNAAKQHAMREIRRLEFIGPFSSFIEKILSSTVNVNRLRKSYLLFVVQTDVGSIYQILFRIRGDPVQFVRIVKAMKIYEIRLEPPIVESVTEGEKV